MKRVIILRGNSGSGKTTVARQLQNELGRHTMLLSQDTLRREVLHAKENMQHPTGELLVEMAHFGWSHGYDTVVVEGIWGNAKNGAALRKLLDEADRSVVCYFDISFEETLRRHATKPNAHEFGEAEMREWWSEKDLLGLANEQMIPETLTKEQIVRQILQDIENK